MEIESVSEARAPERIAPEWQTLVLVCSKCKGCRRGPDSREVRKGIKHRLGKSKQLRIIESECLDVCPDDAVTVCVAKTERSPAAVYLVRAERELDALVQTLETR